MRTPVFSILVAVSLMTTGCSMSNEEKGGLFGAVLGGVAGSHFGKGSGKTIATAIGAGVGALVGSSMGRALDHNSTKLVSRATTQALDSGDSVVWVNPDNRSGPASGRVDITRLQGSCREFQQTVTIGGRTERAYGTACLDRNGDWRIVN